jgi:hypothetical protein
MKGERKYMFMIGDIEGQSMTCHVGHAKIAPN